MTPFNINRALVRSLVIILYLTTSTSSSSDSDKAADITYTLRGDINLGGLFPLHLYNETAQDCGALRGIDALKRVEAMAYTVRLINANKTILTNITLGYEIYDTCSYNAMALRQSLKMIPAQRELSACMSNFTGEPLPMIKGVVGAQRSASSLQAAILFGLYSIPQISYLSTSDELSNDDRYPFFLRTVPPDRFQVEAMVDILIKYNWKYVSFINSDDTYGKSAQNVFRARALENDICLAVTRTIPASTDSYNELIQDLLDTQTEVFHSTVVILFVQLETAKYIFRAAAEEGAYRRFIWIGSDGWGNYGTEPVLGNEEVALGALTVVPLSAQRESYNDYLKTLSPSTSENPWLEFFMEEYGNCKENMTINGSFVCQTRTLEGVKEVDEIAHETIVMDSVLGFAFGLHNMQEALCDSPDDGFCEAMQNRDGADLRNYLLQTKFDSPVNGRIEFLANGDIGGRYGIRNLQVVDGEYSFVDVGSWMDSDSEERLVIQEIPWYLIRNYSLWDDGTPQSVCSKPCELGEKRSGLPENTCCWTCTPCEASAIVTTNGTVCSSCIMAETNYYGWPNDARDMCIELDPNVNRAWTTAIVILSSVGLIGTIITIIVYILNREKPLIKASSRELSYIIFTGLFLAFLTALLYGVQPTPTVCAIRRMGSPVALSLIYVSIATKTIRLYRIFRAGLKSAGRPKYISPSSQVFLTLVICIIPVVWASAWFVIIPPAVVITMPNPNEPKIELTCDEDDIEVIGTLTWEICLIIVCCIFAFVTRKLPENYNESRFITFCVFSSLVVFSSFAPPFFTTNEAVYKASYSALGLIINGTVTTICLFGVKIYALYFVDERELNIFTQSRTRNNTRTNSMINVHSTDGSGPPASPTRTGPQVNHAFANDKGGEENNVNHSSNNNNSNLRTILPPIKHKDSFEQNCGEMDNGFSRSRSSSKNSTGGSGRGGTTAGFMHKLRGNSIRVGDTLQLPDVGGGAPAPPTAEIKTVSQGDILGVPRSAQALTQMKSFSEDSTSSQSDDQRVLLNVKKQRRESPT